MEVFHKKNIILGNLSPYTILIDNHHNIELLSKKNSIEEQYQIYKAPEQSDRIKLQVNNSVDIYSLGIILYEMIKGKFSAKDTDDFSYELLTKKFPLLHEVDMKIPPMLSKIIEKMMTKDSVDRYSEIASVNIDLHKCLMQVEQNKESEEFILDTFKTIFELNQSGFIYGRESQEEELSDIIISKTDSNIIVSISGNSGGIDIFLQKPINPSHLNDILSAMFLDDIQMEHNPYAKEASTNEINVLEGSEILLVEDNITNQEIVIGLLENSGINIDIANNGVEAVDKFEKNDYELILMDIQMPIMDGHEATIKIREIESLSNSEDNVLIPIIALTANAMKEDIQHTKDAGMSDHINKPIVVEKLYNALLKHIPKKNIHKNKNEEIKVQNSVISSDVLDTKQALKFLGGNEKLYFKILNNFYNNYKHITLYNLDDKEFNNTLHSIKGLSANIGATDLYKISTKLENMQNKSILDSWHVEIKKVIDELDKILMPQKGSMQEKLKILLKNINLMKQII